MESVKEWCTLTLPYQRRLALTLDLDTFLTALYTIVDDLYMRDCLQHKPSRPGRRVQLSDSEVLTLMLCSQWFGTSQRAFIRYATEHWRDYFPTLLSQSAFNRRSRDLSGALIAVSEAVSEELGAYTSAYQAIDSVPVPLARRCRGVRHRLFSDEASIGKGGSDRDFYYGCKLLLAVSPDGVITGFMLAPASTEDRWVAESFLCWRNDPLSRPYEPSDLPSPIRHNGKRYVGATGPIWPRSAVGRAVSEPYLADNGFFGAFWQKHWSERYGAKALTPKNYVGTDSAAAKRQHSSRKQVVETINSHLENVFGLHFPLARTKWGLLSRVAAKVAALNVGIWLNRYFGRPDLAFATLFSC